MRQVEVFAEVGCPFAYVGLTRFAQRRAERGLVEPVLHVRAWPLELINGTPLDPAHIAEEVDELRRQVAPDLFAGFDPAAFPTTSLPALRLTAAATAADPRLGEQAAMAVRHALFEEGRDVADPAVLAELAGRLGVRPPTEDEAVLDDLALGRRRGVVGSPHFFFGEDDAFCPTLDIARIDGHLRITADPAAFEAFVARCLA